MSSNLQQSSSTSHPPSPLVWFLLLDSETGEPYKNSSASSIERHLITPPVIDQFRDAVRSKNPNKLASVDASDLLVYKNKAAFDSRSAAENEGKVDPLDPTQSVHGLGSKEDMLVVADPPPPIQPSSFPLCSEEFFNSIFNATETDGGSDFIWKTRARHKFESTLHS